LEALHQQQAWLKVLQGWQVKVWRDYERFIADLTALFPHEKQGIRKLYDEFWKVGAGCKQEFWR
jgi:hypothetical protein